MKKISRTFIPALALILAVLTSCEPDSVSGGRLSSGKPFSFTIGNGSVSSTRGMESRPEVPASSLLCTLESADEDGDAPTLSITQTVTSLDDEWLLTAETDDAASVTRGTPVFTENLRTFAATTYAALTSTTGTTVYNDVWSNMKDAEFTKGTGNVWSHEYTNNERWPEGNGDLTFFMRYPIIATEDLASYARQDGKNVIKFSEYMTPAIDADNSAELQTDIVFATATLNEGNKSTANKLLFYHPLCGVKFKIGTLPTGVSITGVTLKGVYATGDCVITPYYGNTTIWNKTNSNTDGGASTKSDACVVWSNLDNSSTFNQSFTADDAKPELDDELFPEGFADAGTTNPNEDQLNTSTLSKTFNLIPQTFSSERKLTMTIDFSVNGSPMQRSVEVDGIEWKAGHLYTYTINCAENLDVTVTDEVNGNVKSNVVITNTGNTSGYIRAAVTAYWQKEINGEEVIVKNCDYTTEGTLSDLGTDWIKGDDGYYYYKYGVKGGKATNQVLFTSYTADTAPVKGAKLQMSILAQIVADRAAWGTVPAGLSNDVEN